MPQDAYALYHQAKELDRLLAGGRVNRISQPTENEIYLDIYANGTRRKLAISASVASARVCTSSAEKENPLAAFGFCMLLRKHLVNALLESVDLVGFDRVIALEFSVFDELYGAEKKTLYAEIMGKYSNVVLTERGKVLGAMKTAGIEEAARRPLIAGLEYRLPPSQDKFAPDDARLVGALAAFGGGDLGKFLFETVQGFSYRTAEEIAARFGKNTAFDLATAEACFRFIGAFLFSEELKPCVRYTEKGAEDFFLQPYESLGGEYRFFSSIDDAERHFFEEKDKLGIFTAFRNRLTECVKKEEKRLEKRLKIILEKDLDCKDMESDRIRGDLILSNVWRVKKGDKELVCENFYRQDSPETKIPLDVNLSPQENAQKYYKRYNKQKRTVNAVAPQKEEVLKELEYVKSLYCEISLAEDSDALKFVESELVGEGLLKKKEEKKNRKKKTPLLAGKEYCIDGVTVRVGRNNAENDRIVSAARGKDLWLHAKNYHSSHVVIEVREKPVTKEIVTAAAEICAYYSEGREGNKIDIVCAEKKYVKKPPKAPLGFWIYSVFSSVTVNPSKHEEFLKVK